MTLDTREKSRYGANPVELYRFAHGSSIWRYTSADLTVAASTPQDGLQVYPAEAIRRGSPEFSQEDGSGSVDVFVPRWNPVAALFIAAPPAFPVTLHLYRLHADDGELIAFPLKVSSATFEGSEVKLSCAPLFSELTRNIPRIAAQKLCNWALYGIGCGVSKEAFKDTGTVLSVSGATLRAAVLATRANGWFDTGWIERTDGSRQYVLSHAGDTVTLQAPFIGIAAGETILAFAGCLRTEAVCGSKFNNLVNFMGFERIPTRNPYELGMV